MGREGVTKQKLREAGDRESLENDLTKAVDWQELERRMPNLYIHIYIYVFVFFIFLNNNLLYYCKTSFNQVFHLSIKFILTASLRSALFICMLIRVCLRS